MLIITKFQFTFYAEKELRLLHNITLRQTDLQVKQNNSSFRFTSICFPFAELGWLSIFPCLFRVYDADLAVPNRNSDFC